MLYAMIAHDTPDGFEQRMSLRAEHFNYLHSLGDKVVFAGALFGNADKMDGSLMVVEAASLSEAKTLVSGDPFVVRGVYRSYEVKRWNWSVNNPTARGQQSSAADEGKPPLP
jgi:uncharacterized protein YciI